MQCSPPCRFTIFVLGALLAGLTALGRTVGGASVPRFDRLVLHWLAFGRTGTAVERVTDLLYACTALGAACAVGLVVGLLVRHRRADALFAALALAGGLALDPLLKQIFARRPLSDSGAGYSFPSGSSLFLTVMVGALLVVCTPRLRRLMSLAALPLLVGYGVLLVGARWHYPTDVVGGWLAGAAWVTVVWLAFTLRPVGGGAGRGYHGDTLRSQASRQ